MKNQKSHPSFEAATAKIAQHLEALSEDPLKGRFHMDVPTLNLIGEVALDGKAEGDFTSQQLAEIFHHHLERVFSNHICAEHGDRNSMVRVLEMNLRIVAIDGVVSRKVPGYTCIGTLYLRQAVKDYVVTFSFKRHPLLGEIYSH